MNGHEQCGAPNSGVIPLNEAFWERDRPHQDSLYLAHYIAIHLYEAEAECPDLMALAQGLESALLHARGRVNDGNAFVLMGLTVVDIVERGLERLQQEGE